MKDLLDKLKDAGRDALGTFVVLDDDGNEQPQPPVAAPAAATVPDAAGAPLTVQLPGPIAAATVDPEFVQQLQAAVETSGKPAYQQFHVLFDALGAVADPAQRTQLALSAAGASHNVTPRQVDEAIQDRLRILAAERDAFEKAVAAETENSIAATEKRIEAARAEIARKIEEIRQLEATRAELEKGIAEARSTIDANSARFAASYAVVEAGLAAERARIAPFVTPNPA